jgi:hypothetical protein
MKRQLMAEEWDKFARSVLPLNVTPGQRREMRRAFYSGAQSILFRVIQSFAPETEPTDADLQIMNDLQTELQEFGESIQAGRA